MELRDASSVQRLAVRRHSTVLWPVPRALRAGGNRFHLSNGTVSAGAKRALDLICGPGTIAIALSSIVGEVVAVDPDADMIAEGSIWPHRRVDTTSDGCGRGQRTFRSV